MWNKEKESQKIKNLINYSGEFEGKTILLIGSNGFLGRWFYDFFSSLKCDLICMDNDIAPNDKSTTYIKKDICESFVEILPRYRYNIDYIINCAGIASPEKYLKLPVQTLDVSYTGTRNVLELARLHEVSAIMLFSSSEIYGTPEDLFVPTPETYTGRIPTNSNRSCYDVGKLVLETLANVYYRKYNLPIKIVRPFNLYGPYMGIKDNRVLSNFMKCYFENIPAKVYGSGLQTRTYCYAGDGIAAMLKILLEGASGETYNIGKDSPEINVYELAEVFFESLDSEKNIDVIEYPEDYPSDEPFRRCPDTSRLKKEFNMELQTELTEGLRIMRSFFENNCDFGENK